MPGQSTQGKKHPYLKGSKFWENNRFWNTSLYTERAKEYFEKNLDDMRKNERQLTRLGEGKKLKQEG